jgi:hypothetical protein
MMSLFNSILRSLASVAMLCASGCGSPQGDIPLQHGSDTGASEIMVAYIVRGGPGGMTRMLIVTTTENERAAQYRERAKAYGISPDVYLISRKTAQRVVTVLQNEGFYQMQSKDESPNTEDLWLLEFDVWTDSSERRISWRTFDKEKCSLARLVGRIEAVVKKDSKR